MVVLLELLSLCMYDMFRWATVHLIFIDNAYGLFNITCTILPMD